MRTSSTTETTWPPPTGPDDQWQSITTGRQDEAVKVRQVRLWGRSEWIDQAGDVLCGCGRMVPMTELCRPGNGHISSPVAEATTPRTPTIAELTAGETQTPATAMFR